MWKTRDTRPSAPPCHAGQPMTVRSLASTLHGHCHVDLMGDVLICWPRLPRGLPLPADSVVVPRTVFRPCSLASSTLATS